MNGWYSVSVGDGMTAPALLAAAFDAQPCKPARFGLGLLAGVPSALEPLFSERAT